ncbi:hypothetical protein Namu_2580 [Nakamurella multipartita DSM 44233]|uniref:Uncharacterized protein n=1 Tax=Nakamurella multipartita (strain ATCC 700099 / DSM 44233 / CIP 104796 / JCM 9543 / NBRC 105858 / Y-104) TaxID=479431 RepID=C8X7I1_NAKMY|nr:hypothetical protein Namu_2580 [Nakamurella multipartita DSM 44233]
MTDEVRVRHVGGDRFTVGIREHTVPSSYVTATCRPSAGDWCREAYRRA